MERGEPIAILFATGPDECAWGLFPCLAQDMNRAFADELVEMFRATLYDQIRNQG